MGSGIAQVSAVAGHDVILRDVYEKLRPLLHPPKSSHKEIGFHTLLKKPRK